MNNMNLELEKTVCNLCGHDTAELYWKQTDSRYESTPRYIFSLVKCDQCGLIYLNPRPTAKSIGLFYPDSFYANRISTDIDYRGSLKGHVRKLSRNNFLKRNALNEKIAMIKRYYPKRGKILDVGCGNGDFLIGMRRRGWEVVGVDISESLCKLIEKKYGIKTFVGDFNSIELFSNNEFDGVTFWASLEHMHDPNEALRKSYAILRNEGFVIILVPNSDSLEEKYLKNIDSNPIDIPRHLYHFSETTLTSMLNKNGFAVEGVKHFSQNGASRTHLIINRYINKLRKSRSSFRSLWPIGYLISFMTGLAATAITAALAKSHTIIMVGKKDSRY